MKALKRIFTAAALVLASATSVSADGLATLETIQKKKYVATKKSDDSEAYAMHIDFLSIYSIKIDCAKKDEKLMAIDDPLFLFLYKDDEGTVYAVPNESEELKKRNICTEQPAMS